MGVSVTASSSNINVTSDTFAAGGTLQSSGTLTIAPLTAGTSIGIGTGTGTLGLPASYFFTNFVNGFSGITVGGATAGDITVGGAVTYNDPLTLKTAGNITVSSGASLTGTSGQNASLVLWANSSDTGGYVELMDLNSSDATIATNGGGLWIGGGSGTAIWTPYNGATSLTVGNGYAQGTSNYATGVYLGSGSISTGGGNVAIYGKTAVTGTSTSNPDGSTWASGIYSVIGSSYGTVNINSGTGSILLQGTNVLTSAIGGEGIYLNGATLTSSAISGDAITLIGDSSAENYGTGTRGAGVTLVAWTNQPINISATGGGNIVINGTSTAVSSALNYGVRVVSAGATTNITTSGGAGNITVTGTVNDATANYSVGFETATDSISSSGNLTITGTTGNSNNKPIYLAGPVAVSGTTSLTTSGQDITATNGSNNFTGGVTITGANVQIATAAALVLSGDSAVTSLTAAAGTNISGSGTLSSTTGVKFNAGSGSGTYDGIISGAGDLSMAGAGTLILAGVNTYTGGTTINGGTLQIGTGGQLGGGNYSGSLSVASGTTFTWASDQTQTFSNLAAGGSTGTINFNGTAGTVTISGDQAFTGTVNIAQNVTISGGSNASIAGVGNSTAININNGGYVTLESSGIGCCSGGVDNDFVGYGSSTSLTINSGGTLYSPGANTFHLPALTLNGGNLASGTPTADGLSSGLFGLDNGVTVTADSTISAQTLILSQSGSTTFNVATGKTLNVSGTILHTGQGPSGWYWADSGISKTGGGKLVLSGANSFQGTVSVSAGTMAIENNSGLGSTSCVTVASGATLDLRGVSIGSIPVILNGGTIEASTGTSLLAGTVALNNPSTIAANLGASLTVSGSITASSNTLTINGGGNVTLSNSSNSLDGGVNATSVANLTIINGSAMTLNGVAASGTVDVETVSGDLTVAGNVKLLFVGHHFECRK